MRFWTLILAMAALTSWNGPGLRASLDDVSVVLELSQDYYYEGDPVLVRVSIRNTGPAAVDNPVVMRLLQGLKVRKTGGSRLRPAASGDVREPNRPDRLQPESFYGAVMDISGMFPQTLKAGHYEMLWDGNGLQSQIVAARVIPRFDPRADYVGEIVTNLGTIRVDLAEELSPVAVKAFVDLAQAGYYDGQEIDEVRPDQLIAGGGPPGGGGPGGRAFSFPAEQSIVPLDQGTVILEPTGAAPPANGARFMILLRPQPAWVGQVTVLGQVIQGLEGVAGLARVPSSGPEGSPPFRPASPIKIENVLISKRNPAAGAIGKGHGQSLADSQESVDLSEGSPYIQTH